MELKGAFEWLGLPADQRDPEGAQEIKGQLLKLWLEVRERVGGERFDATLGEARAGRFARRGESIWTQTNAEHEQGDYVNLTLELDRDELSLNVIGWFDPQLEKVERWLLKPASWRFMCQAVLGGEDPETAAREQRIADYGELRRELIGIERDVLLELRGAERLRNMTMRQIERDLDLEEARIRS